MFLAARTRTALLAVAVFIVGRSAVAEEPAPTKEECIATSESGQDLREAGKLLDARKQFAMCVAASCPRPIRDDCAQRSDEIAKAMPSIVFDVTDSLGNAVPGVAITIDGHAVADASNANAVELDPGEHTFSFEAGGLRKIEKRIELLEGVKERREVVIMDRADAIAGVASPTTGEAATPWASPPTLALVAFGVGGAGLVLGITAGLVAGGKHSTLEGECGSNTNTCAPQYADDLDSFHTWRTISTVGYVVGVLGVAGGAVLWLTAPKERNAAATGVWLGPASAGVSRRF